MKLKLLLSLVLTGNYLLMSGSALAITEHDFEALTTQNLINLCTVSSQDPLAQQAINFCHGYLVGAADFYFAERKGSVSNKETWFCLPKPEPSRNDIVAKFVKWAEAHPQYMQEMPVETEFRFFIDTYPCKK